jgi:amino acid transporter
VIVSILIVTAIDFLISVSFTGVVPWREMVRPGSQAFNAIGSVYMQRVGGHWASVLMTIMVEVTAFAATYALMLGYSRIPYAAALDGAFFRWFGEVHPTKRFPHRALLLVGLLVIVACFFDLVQIITALMLARILSMFVAQIIGLLVYRRYHPEAPRPFRMWLYPLPAIFALVGWLGVFVTPALQPNGWQFMAYAFGTGVCGVFCAGLQKAGVAIWGGTAASNRLAHCGFWFADAAFVLIDFLPIAVGHRDSGLVVKT